MGSKKEGKTVFVFLPLPVRQHCTAHCPWETGTYESIYNEIINSKCDTGRESFQPYSDMSRPPHIFLSPLAFQPTTSPLWLKTSVAAGEAGGGRTTHSPTTLGLHWAAPSHAPRESNWGLLTCSGSELVTRKEGTLSSFCLLSQHSAS